MNTIIVGIKCCEGVLVIMLVAARMAPGIRPVELA